MVTVSEQPDAATTPPSRLSWNLSGNNAHEVLRQAVVRLGLISSWQIRAKDLPDKISATDYRFAIQYVVGTRSNAAGTLGKNALLDICEFLDVRGHRDEPKRVLRGYIGDQVGFEYDAEGTPARNFYKEELKSLMIEVAERDFRNRDA